jgi:hypothetical protein
MGVNVMESMQMLFAVQIKKPASFKRDKVLYLFRN